VSAPSATIKHAKTVKNTEATTVAPVVLGWSGQSSTSMIDRAAAAAAAAATLPHPGERHSREIAG